ncbi:MAG: hypothetical protein M3383_06260 [Actinomycetota bacterium]|nr:hypothetical protein [Actinomycetota bacterium]
MPEVDVSAQDRFVLRQRVKLVINQYEFSTPDEAGDGEPFCFVEQKRFKFKEDIRFFTDDTKQQEILKILARQRFDPRARYDVTLPDGTKVGQIQKVFGKSLLRSTFVIYDGSGQEVATARERSLPVALVRRVIGLIPYVEIVAEWLPIPYDFEFLHGEEQLGMLRRRRMQWRDIYDFDLTGDPARTIDRRLALAIAVGMDALQAR